MRLARTLVMASCLLLACSIGGAGTLTTGLSFVAITPCRIIDTRNGTGFTGAYGPPALVAGAVRTFPITGATSGTPTQCGIPDEAEAISVNFTATGFSGPGDLRAFPAGGLVPNASVLNYRLENIANTVTVPLGSTGGGHNGISLQADVSDTQLVVDVSGYYTAKALSASLLGDATLIQGSHVTLVGHLTTGSYFVVFDRDVTACAWIATVSPDSGGVIVPGFAYPTPLSTSSAGLLVKTTGVNSVAGDRAFTVTVTCP